MANSVRIAVGVKDDASGPIDRIRDSFARLQKQGAQGIIAGVAAGATVSAFNAIGQAARQVTDFLADSVRASIEEEAGIKRLAQSLEANVKGFDGDTTAIEKNIAAKERLGFSDDELRDSLGHLSAATHDIGDALALQSTAMDLARFSGTDLASATDTLVRVQAGNYRGLKALGIEIDATATRTEAFAAVQKVVAGQSEAFGNTTAGAMAAAAVAVNNLQEDIGGLLAPVIKDIANFLRNDLIPAFRELGNVISSLPWDQIAAGARLAFGPFINAAEGVRDTKKALDEFTAGNKAALAAAAETATYIAAERTAAEQATAGLTGMDAAFVHLAVGMGDAHREGTLAKDTLLAINQAALDGYSPISGYARILGDIVPHTLSSADSYLQGLKVQSDAVAEAQRLAADAKAKADAAAAAAAAKAKAAAEALARTVAEKLRDAYNVAKDAAHAMFDAIHQRNSKAIDDVRDLANASLDAQEKAIRGTLTAEQQKVQAIRDQTRENVLRANVANAKPEDRDSAVAALNEFLTDQRLKFLGVKADTQIAGLEGQKGVNDAAAIAAHVVEDTRAAKAERIFDQRLEALQKLGRPIQIVQNISIGGEKLKQIIGDYLAGENLIHAPSAPSTGSAP